MYKFREWLSSEIMLDSFLDVIVLKLKQNHTPLNAKYPRTKSTQVFGVMT